MTPALELGQLRLCGTSGSSLHLTGRSSGYARTLCGYGVRQLLGNYGEDLDEATCRVCRKRAGLPRLQP